MRNRSNEKSQSSNDDVFDEEYVPLNSSNSPTSPDKDSPLLKNTNYGKLCQDDSSLCSPLIVGNSSYTNIANNNINYINDTPPPSSKRNENYLNPKI